MKKTTRKAEKHIQVEIVGRLCSKPKMEKSKQKGIKYTRVDVAVNCTEEPATLVRPF